MTKLHKGLICNVKRIERKKKKTKLGTKKYLGLCIEQCELGLRCLRAIYWSSHCNEV